MSIYNKMDEKERGKEKETLIFKIYNINVYKK